ncbi:thioredoxin [Clavulina sp. PMI_390]|nr:thioredoxin [Clavulina sp. PMI_390]
MTVTAIDSYDKFQELINSGKPIFIDFWATWCGPCRMISPIFEKLSEASERSGQDYGFYKVDVDEQERIAEELRITAMPTFVLFKDGKKINEVVGANPPALMNMITSFKK